MTRRKRILVVEDDPGIRQGVVQGLQLDGFEVLEAATLVDAGKAIKEPLDLILLDVMLPDGNGLDLLRALRTALSATPVLVLTARGDEEDRVLGFEHGCDDYVVKPFSLRELRLRIQALLRRADAESTTTAIPATFQVGAAQVDLKAYRVTREGTKSTLSPREKETLEYFLARPGQVVSRQELLREVWGYDRSPVTRTVDMHVRRLREKLEVDPDFPRFLITVHGAGYRLDLPQQKL